MKFSRPIKLMLVMLAAVMLLCACSRVDEIRIVQYVRSVYTPEPTEEAQPEESVEPEDTPEPTPTVRPLPEVTPVPEPVENSNTQPPLLKALADKAYLSLADTAFDQLILVSVGEDNTCKIYCYNKRSQGIWKRESTIGDMTGYISTGGLAYRTAPGDEKTPMGLIPLGEAFGSDTTANTRMSYSQLSNGDVWVTDPASKYYNTLANSSAEDKDWQSEIALTEDPANYSLALVGEYNYGEEMHPKIGPALLIHSGTESGTMGIAMDRNALLDVLSWLNAASSPHVLIMPEE